MAFTAPTTIRSVTGILTGDCRDALNLIPDGTVSAVITDPPYDLTGNSRNGSPRTGGTGPYGRHTVGTDRGFMNSTWDGTGVAFDPETWRQVVRVTEPGAPVLAFSAPRTWHRMASAMEHAGLVIVEVAAWTVGSGFPKSMNVAKAVDRVGGVSPAQQAQALRAARETAGMTRQELAERIGCTPSSVRDWEEGRARATGTPVEWLVPSPAYRAALQQIFEYSSDERTLLGTCKPDRRDDGTIYGLGHTGRMYGQPVTDAAAEWDGWGTALKPAWEPIVVAWYPHPDLPPPPTIGEWYGSKASGAERVEVDGTEHPTVKPLALIDHLVSVVNPTGLVLDPFLGSGTTAEVCEFRRIPWVGVERCDGTDDQPDYVPLIQARIARVTAGLSPLDPNYQKNLAAHERRQAAQERGQHGLFEEWEIS